MGKSQREKARTKRGQYTATPYTRTAASHLSHTSTSTSPPTPHHLDLLRVAFLEWLIAHRSTAHRHSLWSSFLADFSSIPDYELPFTIPRPFNLHSLVKQLRSGATLHSWKTEVKEAREKLAAAGGLKPHLSLLAYHLEGDAADPAHNAADAAAVDVEEHAREEEEEEEAVADSLHVHSRGQQSQLSKPRASELTQQPRHSLLAASANAFAVLGEG